MPALRTLLLALTTGALLAGCGDDGAGTVDGDGYSLQAPAGWREGDGEDLGDAVGADIYDTFLAGETEGQFTENFNVVIQDGIPAGIDAEAWARQGSAQLARPGAGEQIFPDAEAFEPPSGPPQRTTLGGEEAYEIEYSATFEGQEIGFRAVATVHDGRGYIGTFASGESPAAAEEQFSAIADSWEFD